MIVCRRNIIIQKEIMSLIAQLKACHTLDALANLITQGEGIALQSQIGRFGGRYFRKIDGSLSGYVNLNDIIRQYAHIMDSQQQSIKNKDSAEISRVNAALYKLVRSNDALKVQNCFIRILTYIKQIFGKWCVENRVKQLRQKIWIGTWFGDIELAAKLQKQNVATQKKEEAAVKDNPLPQADQDRLSTLSLTDLMKEYPLLNGQVQQNPLVASSRSKRAFVSNLIVTKINNLLVLKRSDGYSYLGPTNRMESELSDLGLVHQNLSDEAVREIALLIAENSTHPLLETCLLLHIFCSPNLWNKLAKELAEKISVQIEKRGFIPQENKKPFLNIDARNFENSFLLPVGKALDLLAESFSLVFHKYGEETLKGIAESLRKGTAIEYGFVIQFPYRSKGNLSKDFLEVMLTKLKQPIRGLAGLYVMQEGIDATMTVAARNKFGKALAEVIEVQPGLIFLLDQFKGITDPAYAAAKVKVAQKHKESISKQTGYWIKHVRQNLTLFLIDKPSRAIANP